MYVVFEQYCSRLVNKPCFFEGQPDLNDRNDPHIFYNREEDNLVMVRLDDRNEELAGKLTLKLKTTGNQPKAFSGRFDFVSSFEYAPASSKGNACQFDLQLSADNELLLISDFNRRVVKTFDTTSKNLVHELHVASRPYYLTVASTEKHTSSNTTSIMISCEDHCVYRYDFKVNQQNTRQTNQQTVWGSSNDPPTQDRVQTMPYVWRAGTPDDSGYINQMNCPRGVAVNRNASRVYVNDYRNHRIQILAYDDGSFIGQIPSTFCMKIPYPWALALTREEHFVVSEFTNHRIQKISKTGKGMMCFGNKGSSFSEFDFPRKIIVDASTQNILVCDRNNRVQIFSPTGKFITCHQCLEAVPLSMCINQKTGELFIINSRNSISIFK